jgi:hypothetical protein
MRLQFGCGDELVSFGWNCRSAMMSQRDVENLLGRLLTDGTFRRRFFSDPEQVVSEESLHLIPRELEAVLATDAEDIEQLTRRLDPRIVQADPNRKRLTNSRTGVSTAPKRKLEHKRNAG